MQPLHTLSFISAMFGIASPRLRDSGTSPRDFGEAWNRSTQRRRANRKAKKNRRASKR